MTFPARTAGCKCASALRPPGLSCRATNVSLPRNVATSAFPPTRWSIIAELGPGRCRNGARTALAELCRLYWYPLYAFARRSGLNPPDAEDATQAFFLAVLEGNLFAAADPSIGRLRSFLLKAFSRDLADSRRDARRQKRGGNLEIVPLTEVTPDAEGRFLAESTRGAAAHQFEQAWASAVLEGALQRVESDYSATGRAEVFEALRPMLGGAGEVPAAEELAASLQLSPMAFRQALSRLRERFRVALRAQIADTLRDPSEAAIDDELRALREVMAPG